MSLLAYRFLGVTAILLVYTHVVQSSFTFLALAQESSPFEISVVTQAEYAIAGKPFTYTIVVTNVSRQPLKDVIVQMKTPEGSTFAETHFANPDWLVGGVQRGEAGEVIWFTHEPIAPGEVVTFDLVINVLSEPPGQELIVKEYIAAPIDNSPAIASGPPVETQVQTLTPTLSPTVRATDTPTVIALDSPIPTSPATSEFVIKAPTTTALFTQTPQSDATVTKAATPTAVVTSQDTVSTTTLLSIPTTLAVGLLGSIIAIIGSIWLLRRERN